MIQDFEAKLQTYADVIVKVGLNLQPGQRLIIGGPEARGVPLDAAPLVRRLVASAYRNGARFVEVLWSDPQVTLTRYQLAPRDSFDQVSEWMIEVRRNFVEKGDALLTVRGNDPELLKGQDPNLIGQEISTILKKYRPVSELVSSNAINWCVIAAPTPAWAARVFPNLPAEQAVEHLWESIFSICRIDQADPLAAWKAHDAQLTARADYLTARGYDAFHYTGPGTDLTLGMPVGALWEGGGSYTRAGIYSIANLPTEEVFSLPHRERIDGTIRATRPLSYNGSLIEDFSLTFEKGRVVSHAAKQGGELLGQLLDTGEGSRSLGEIALVPYSSPISQTGILFYDGLVDENAACHLALGRAYRSSLKDGEKMTPSEFLAAGGNDAPVHVDFMVGSNELDVDGITREGAVEPVLRKGEWAFTP